MATTRQQLGAFGEQLVCARSSCPRCKRPKTLKRLPTNFKCAEVICDFCGYLAQVKTVTTNAIETVPNTVLGAAWSVQEDRMNNGIYYPLFLVLVAGPKQFACYYLAADLQSPDMFSPRKPLSATARRSGWQGFMYILTEKKQAFVRLF